jgi:hypothetical protein
MQQTGDVAERNANAHMIVDLRYNKKHLHYHIFSRNHDGVLIVVC